MVDAQQLIANYTSNDKMSLQTFEIPENYSQLLNKLEQLALGLETTFANFSLDHKAVEFAMRNGSNTELTEELLRTGIGQSTQATQLEATGFSRVFSDIWIGVILTLLIVSVIFFICAGFLYHKFQQWKSSYRANANDASIEICRHYPGDFEAESLPSYTIVSGLPTYDDALEQFRKAGIILTPRVPIIKIFDANGETKDPPMFNFDSNINDLTVTSANSADAISMASVCTCGANNNATTLTPPQTPQVHKNTKLSIPGTSHVIELSPEQLAQLSHKRLSLQITFNNSVRRPSRQRVDLYRAANRNNLLRSRALSNTGSRLPISQPASPSGSSANQQGFQFFAPAFPTIHRSTSSGSLMFEQQANSNARQQQHRGSLS